MYTDHRENLKRYVVRELGEKHYVVRIFNEQGGALLLRNDTVEVVTVPEANRTLEETHSLPPWVRYSFFS